MYNRHNTVHFKVKLTYKHIPSVVKRHIYLHVNLFGVIVAQQSPSKYHQYKAGKFNLTCSLVLPDVW